MVDPVRLARLLQRLGEQLSHLEARAGEDRDSLRHDEVRLSATKYRFVTAIEAMLDIAHHLLASERWGPADDSADAVRILARHGVVDAVLAQQLAEAVGFRNVLVHGYAEVDDDRVIDVARLVSPLDTPQLAGLEPVDVVADASPGFVWRLQTEDRDATAVRAFEWDIAGRAGRTPAEHRRRRGAGASPARPRADPVRLHAA